jgi:hypothetical protein
VSRQTVRPSPDGCGLRQNVCRAPRQMQ